MTALPTGTVTFLFSDIQGSTRLWQSYPHQMKKALARHDALLREAIGAHSGFVFKTVGDAFCAAFDTAMDGLKAALAGQLAISREDWQLPQPICVRMALHTGEAVERDRDYYGPALNRVARLEAIGYGGQTLVSLVTAELVRDTLPEDVSLMEMGEQRLKDLTRPEVVYQLAHPELPSEFPALKSLDARPHNLPVQPTALIGREKELESVEKLLLDPAVRILTLTGPGGMGKTRLSLQAAADLIDGFRHGAFFVDLAQVSDPNLMATAIARSLHVKESAGRPPAQAVKEHLCGRTLLLVLDNFEQILEAATQIVELLGSCPGVKFLVTSREPLRVRGEKVFAVPPLSLPALPFGPGAEGPELGALTAYEAVRLFIERATAVRRDFQVNNDNAPAVAEICVGLDGIPLAIELAAARIKLLSPQGILSRLDRRLRLLTGGARDLPDRQKTLRATIDWSHELLDERGRGLFRTLSVFAGGFTLEAAGAVAAGKEGCEDELLDGLESLVDKSLLGLHEAREGQAGGEPRFRLLETIREYALEKLRDSGEEAQASQRHAQYYLQLGEGAEPHLEGPEQGRYLQRLDEDIENFRAVLRFLSRQASAGSLRRVRGSDPSRPGDHQRRRGPRRIPAGAAGGPGVPPARECRLAGRKSAAGGELLQGSPAPLLPAVDAQRGGSGRGFTGTDPSRQAGLLEGRILLSAGHRAERADRRSGNTLHLAQQPRDSPAGCRAVSGGEAVKWNRPMAGSIKG